MVDKKIGMMLAVVGGSFYTVGGLIPLAEAFAFSLQPPGASLGFTNVDFSVNFRAQAPIFFASSITYLIAGLLIIIAGILVSSEKPKRRQLGGIQAIIMSVVGIVSGSILVATELRIPGLFFETNSVIEAMTFGLPLTISGALLALTYRESESINRPFT